MTTIKIFKTNGKLYGLSACGHTGFEEYGNDILCASISSIIQTAGLGIRELVTKDVNLICKEEPPKFEIILPKNLSESKYLQAELILNTCILGLLDLQSGYPKNIKVEVKNDVY